MPAEAVTRIEKENVLLQIGDCAVTILPQFGGKVASILVKGHELLQAPLVPYAPRTRTMGFNEGDASGWDECLPSVSGCTVQTANGPASVPDHGDLWRVEWKVLSSANGSVTLQRRLLLALPLKLGPHTDADPDRKGLSHPGRLSASPTPATRKLPGPGRRIPATPPKRATFFPCPTPSRRCASSGPATTAWTRAPARRPGPSPS